MTFSAWDVIHHAPDAIAVIMAMCMLKAVSSNLPCMCSINPIDMMIDHNSASMKFFDVRKFLHRNAIRTTPAEILSMTGIDLMVGDASEYVNPV